MTGNELVTRSFSVEQRQIEALEKAMNDRKLRSVSQIVREALDAHPDVKKHMKKG